jgi:hypothetical protein
MLPKKGQAARQQMLTGCRGRPTWEEHAWIDAAHSEDIPSDLHRTYQHKNRKKKNWLTSPSPNADMLRMYRIRGCQQLPKLRDNTCWPTAVASPLGKNPQT